MTKILLIDDDMVVVDIYCKKLQQQGYEVTVAHDGLDAMKAVSAVRPQLVLLDIMMPKFNGLEVLDFIRSRPELANTKVVVFSNCYISGENRRATTQRADRELVKSSCTPSMLLEEISAVLAEPTRPKSSAPTGNPPPAPASPEQPASVAASDSPPAAAASQSDARIRQDFLANAPVTLATLRQLNAAFIRAETSQARHQHLLDFYRKIHYLTAIAGMAGCHQIAMLANAFEALLLELHEKPKNIGPSTLQTIAFTLDFLALLFGQVQSDTAPRAAAKALVVDDDAMSARAVAMALQRINFEVTAIHDPVAALKLLGEKRFNLILLDVLMPGMDGMELCKKIRARPEYQKTPVIFITGHADFQRRVQSVLSGGNDLIAKPIFPIELAVKAVTQLLRSQLPANLAVG
jgi:CheY-like chemotaxis protein